MARHHKVDISDDLSVDIRSFPADVCLDTFATVQQQCFGDMSLYFGNQDSSQMSQTQIAEAISSAIFSLSRTLDGKTFRAIREQIAPEAFVSIKRPNGEFVRMNRDNIERLDIRPGELIKIIVESAKFQFSDVFTSAADLIGLGNSQTPVGRLLASFKTAPKD